MTIRRSAGAQFLSSKIAAVLIFTIGIIVFLGSHTSAEPQSGHDQLDAIETGNSIHNQARVEPMKPENFTCVSRNWESLTCSWDPVPSNVATNYTLRFHFSGRAGGRTVHSCPEPKEDEPPNTCMLGSTTDPIYRQSQLYYHFMLNVSNVFGEKIFPYLFNHYAYVIPSPPVDLTVVNKTFSSALLYWTIPYPLESFPPGLHSKISYQCLHDQTKTWEDITLTNDIGARRNRYFNLTNLRYANAPYEVRVSLKSAVAIDENHWSAYSSYTFKTAPTQTQQRGSFGVVLILTVTNR